MAGLKANNSLDEQQRTAKAPTRDEEERSGNASLLVDNENAPALNYLSKSSLQLIDNPVNLARGLTSNHQSFASVGSVLSSKHFSPVSRQVSSSTLFICVFVVACLIGASDD